MLSWHTAPPLAPLLPHAARSCVMPALCVAWLLLTACADPGVLPRQEPDEEWLSGRKPRTKEVIVNGHPVQVGRGRAAARLPPWLARSSGARRPLAARQGAGGSSRGAAGAPVVLSWC